MTSDSKQWLLEIILMILAVIAMASAPARGAVLVSQSTVSSLSCCPDDNRIAAKLWREARTPI